MCTPLAERHMESDGVHMSDNHQFNCHKWMYMLEAEVSNAMPKYSSVPRKKIVPASSRIKTYLIFLTFLSSSWSFTTPKQTIIQPCTGSNTIL